MTTKESPAWSLSLAGLLIALQHITLYLNNSLYISVGAGLVFLFCLIFKQHKVLSLSVLYLLTYWLGPKIIPMRIEEVAGLFYLIPVLFTLPVAFAVQQPNIREWFRSEPLSRNLKLFVVATIILSSLALFLWTFYLFDQSSALVDLFRGIKNYPRWVVFTLVVPLAATINALSEEVFFRGIVQDTLQLCSKNPFVVLGLQAAAFASIHYAHGFPNGRMGYLMAFVYGVCLGFLRIKSRGLRVPWITHVLADVTIFYLVAWML